MPSTRLIIQEILCVLFFLAIFTWLAGYYVVISQSLPASGYGDVTKKLNIAAIFFDQTWSIALSYLPQLVSPLASNNFLGMGIILGLIFIALLIISKKYGPSMAVKKRRGLIFCMFICVFVAMTNNIHIGNLHLYIPLPEEALNVLGVVRGSTRFFWPAYYLIIYIFLFIIIKQFTTKHSRIILTLLLCIQLFDISHGFLSKRNSVFLNSAPSFDSPLQDPFWKKAGVIYNSLYLVPELRERTSFEIFGTFALRNNMKTNSALIARVDLAKVTSSNQVFDHAVTSGSYEPRSLYIIDDDLVLAVSKNLNSGRDLFARIDGFNVVAPGWLSCADCPVVSPQSVIKRVTPPPAKIGSEFLFGKGDLGASYLYGVGQFERIGWGWAYPEKWGTWSEGRQAKLFIPYPENVIPKSLTLTMKALISKTQSSQRVEIWINNQLQQTATLNKSDGNVVFISLPISARNFALIDLHFPDAISPQELGIGNDTRKLAIGLESAVLRD